MSVICFLNKAPDTKTIDMMTARAKKFCEQYTDHTGSSGLKLLSVSILNREYKDKQLARYDIDCPT